MKLCVSIAEETTAAALARMAGLLPHADLFEVRADFLRDLDLPALLRERRRPLLFTCRTQAEGGRWPDGERERLHQMLAEAARLGFDFVDVEARAGFPELLRARGGRGIVLSWHDFEGTPGDLDAVYERMAACRPEVVKIAVRANGIRDLGRLLAFARRHGAAGAGAPALVVVAMGPLGTASRLLGARHGAPFTFAATANGHEAGPGQLPAAVLDRVYRVRSLGASTRVYGVLGTDVLRSLSPAIHNRGFEALGEDAVYVPLQAESLEGFLAALPDLGLAGFSITRPYKQAILPHLSQVAAPAAHAGSVNTVVVQQGRLVGSSTDGEGVLVPLRRRTEVANRRVLLLGAGGAARAAAFALLDAGARVTIAARRPEAAAALAEACGAGAAAASLSEAARLEWDVLLNATPVGSAASPAVAPLPERALRPGAVVFDMVYDPLETPLLAAARSRGCSTIDGLEMLVAQAVGQLRAWTGRAPGTDLLTRAATEAIAEMRR